MSSIIKKIKAREIIDSRGNPTIEVELTTNRTFKSSVPSGASTGKNEARELRDGGKRYMSKGVLKAVDNINGIISQKLTGKKVLNQKEIDYLMIKLDGTINKSRLGGNAILAVSMAVCRAGTEALNKPLYQYISELYGGEISLPVPCFNVVNGGVHAGNNFSIQEFMVVPQQVKFADNLQQGVETYHSLKNILKDKFGKESINLGDEGGFAPDLKGAEEALSLILKASEKAGYGSKTSIGLDAAASCFHNKNYHFEGNKLNTEELLDFYKKIIDKFPIIFIEDPFAENDLDGFQKITRMIDNKVFILGDDLLTTNIESIRKAKSNGACSGAIIKPNQVGTVTETLEAAKEAKSYGWKILVSHRSGDTCDSFISDLAVGIGADFIKSGAPARGERVSKYNRLLEIEEEI